MQQIIDIKHLNSFSIQKNKKRNDTNRKQIK